MRRVFALFCLLFCQSGCGAPAMPTSDRVEISVEAPVKAKVSEMAEMPGQAGQKNGCPFLKSNGECLSCDSPESFEVALEEDCARLCPGRNVLSLGQGAYTTYYCAPKTVQSPFEMNINETDETEVVPASGRGNIPGKRFRLGTALITIVPFQARFGWIVSITTILLRLFLVRKELS